MSEARGGVGEQSLQGGTTLAANISSASTLLVEYPAAMAVASEGGEHLECDGEAGVTEPRATSSGIVVNDPAGTKLNKATESLRRASSDSLSDTTTSTRSHHHGHPGILHEKPLDIQCGEKTALLFVSKLCQGSKGPCILYNNEWLTPNELQYICGRETAKDWKRSIRHKGKSLKSLIAQGFLKVHPPICDCPGCRVSSPVNRSRLADKCGLSKIPSYLAEKSMADGFPTMWRRNSGSSDEGDQPNVLHSSENVADDESRPRRSHSDEPLYYRPSDMISVPGKRPRSSSPDLDRGRIDVKRRCMSETSAEEHVKPTASEVLVKARLSLTSHGLLPFVVDGLTHLEPKREMMDHQPKREQHHNAATGPASLGRDHPVLTLPSSVFPSTVLYGHNQAHLGLHRHVASPRILSPPFVRPTSSPSAQIRVLHEQAVTPLPAHIFTQQLRQEYPNVGMATMFPYSFAHPLPSNQLLSTHFQKLTPELERHIASTAEPASAGNSNAIQSKQDKTNPPPKDHDRTSEHSSSPGSDPFSGRKEVDGQTSGDKSCRSSVDENFKFNSDEPEEQDARVYPELAQIAAQWDIDEVCKFVNSVTGSTEYCDVFREQEIDGQALILLTEEHLSNKMGIKLGPALKIKSKIDELRCVYTK